MSSRTLSPASGLAARTGTARGSTLTPVRARAAAALRGTRCGTAFKAIPATRCSRPVATARAAWRRPAFESVAACGASRLASETATRCLRAFEPAALARRLRRWAAALRARRAAAFEATTRTASGRRGHSIAIRPRRGRAAGARTLTRTPGGGGALRTSRALRRPAFVAAAWPALSIARLAWRRALAACRPRTRLMLGLPVRVPLPARSRRPHRLVVGLGERLLERLESPAARDVRLLLLLIFLFFLFPLGYRGGRRLLGARGSQVLEAASARA